MNFRRKSSDRPKRLACASPEPQSAFFHRSIFIPDHHARCRLLHVLEALPGHILALPGSRVTPSIRKAFRRPLIVNGGYTAELGALAIERGETDLIAYGVPFLANPDLVERYRTGEPLNAPDSATFYAAGAKGYTDYFDA